MHSKFEKSYVMNVVRRIINKFTEAIRSNIGGWQLDADLTVKTKLTLAPSQKDENNYGDINKKRVY